MKNAQELIDVLEKVNEDQYYQDSYFNIDASCGCAMQHFELHKFGKRNLKFGYVHYFDLDQDQADYIFGHKEAIKGIARVNGWPIPTEFTVKSAIERIRFINKLTKK